MVLVNRNTRVVVKDRSVGLGLLTAVLSIAAIQGCDTHRNPLTELQRSVFPPTPGEYARDAFNVYDADKRRVAVNELSAAKFGGEDSYVRVYRLLIDDGDATVRAACVKALGLHGSAQDAELIVPRLSDPSPFVRWEAAKAMQKIYSPASVPLLLTAMSKDEDADVRMSAAIALGQHAQPAVFNALVGALDDSDFGVTQAARVSLTTLTGNDLGSDAGPWLSWAQKRPATELFEKRQQYVWTPYLRPRGFWDRVQFWNEAETVSPQVPRGAVDQAGVSTQTQPRG